jgi:quercetin dioxygenase-like cupin family protein
MFFCGAAMTHDYFPPKEQCPHHEVFPGVHVCTCWGERLMLSLADVEPNGVVPEHHHPHEQMGFVIKGRARFIIGGVERTLGPGDWYLIPSNVRHKVIALDEPFQALDVFSPPREEYK